MVIDFMGEPYEPNTAPRKSITEMADLFVNFETQRRIDIARELAGVIAEINTSDLRDMQKGYLEAHLLLIAGMVGTECLDDLKRRLRENG